MVSLDMMITSMISMGLGAFFAWLLIRSLFTTHTLVKECDKCDAAVIPLVNGMRVENDEKRAYFCDRCLLEIKEEMADKMIREYGHPIGGA